MKAVRVLWLAKGLGPGGMERLLVNHAQTADRGRLDYYAAYLVDRPDSVIGELEEAGVACTRLGNGSPVSPGWLAALRRFVKDKKIDVVHAHSPQPAALARPMIKAMPHAPAFVYTEHNTWDCYSLPTRLLNAATFPLDSARFAVSGNAAASAPGPLRRRTEVITHGVDQEALASHSSRSMIRDELGIDESAPIVVSVAHLRTEKAHEVLLEAALDVVDEHPDVRILCVGHGPRLAELERMVERLDLSENVRFLGFRDDVPEILRTADVFCLSSHQEGLPLAFMEASTLGLPSVVTAVGGLPDHVENGVNGILVPPADPRSLGAALNRILGDDALRSSMAASALARAGAFDATSAVSRQESVYIELAERRARRGGPQQGRS